ncbi:pyruvate kinase, variant [Aphanomyces invadans]|uniref:Pyruvate kinase n=1 Tax=Aphanomyces invadans TaxID=157072 RepID=A0A024TFC7_9STRA|nr:pyruvate kinase, variant [Aphanomyces invadans]ETV92291.1 pyruvate kinase, variant [Aphanomyces invadans]|eukprot:XP_008879042.1 pyruvate kinase, variant [Aphanomyces invadans]
MWTSRRFLPRHSSPLYLHRWMSTTPPQVYVPLRARDTKIMCTVGPASESVDILKRLITSGARIFRLNFSHGDFDSHAKRLKSIRKASEQLQIPVAVCGDLQGPKIRVGHIPSSIQMSTSPPALGGLIVVKTGDTVILSACAEESVVVDGVATLALTYKDLVHEVSPGHLVLINDGAIRMEALSSKGDSLHCRVLVGGAITSGKGINLPDSDIKAPAITDKDWMCVEWAKANHLDYVALSFVRNAAEVVELKAALGDGLHVISKIEKPQAIRNLNEIIEASDAIMVARGDLGVEMELAAVPIIQKQIISRCQLYGKPSIIATQMLESMIQSPIPTRAEASDVANAIWDGADAVMLSAESATGNHPELVVATMADIIEQAESLESHKSTNSPPERNAHAHKLTAALAYGAWHVVNKTEVKVVVCWSQHGNAARYLSQNDFRVPIVAFSDNQRSVNQMALYNGKLPNAHRTTWAHTDTDGVV